MWQIDCKHLHIADSDTQLFRCRRRKELIAVQHSPVVTFDQQRDLLYKCVRLLCHSYLRGSTCMHINMSHLDYFNAGKFMVKYWD